MQELAAKAQTSNMVKMVVMKKAQELMQEEEKVKEMINEMKKLNE